MSAFWNIQCLKIICNVVVIPTKREGHLLCQNLEVAVTYYKSLLDCYYNCLCCVMFQGCPPMADIRSLTQKCFSSCCDGLVNCKFLDCLLPVSDEKYPDLTKLTVLSDFQTTCSPPFFSKRVLVLILSHENKLSFKSHAKVRMGVYQTSLCWRCSGQLPNWLSMHLYKRSFLSMQFWCHGP